jgi:hypothetical protein
MIYICTDKFFYPDNFCHIINLLFATPPKADKIIFVPFGTPDAFEVANNEIANQIA